MSAIGTILQGRYELVAEIGRGGMSIVYLARDLTLDCYWAVKQVRNDLDADLNVFKQEVDLLSTLNNPNIPRIVERVVSGDYFYVVMDFIDGVSLEKKVKTEGPQSESVVVEWCKMLCDVLDYLHTVREHPIVYRDMKPNNVMLTKAGRPMLIDFGIALESRRGQTYFGENVGTKGFAAPEQYGGGSNKLDERTDIYSLGATMAYLLTGITPKRPPKGVRSVRTHNPALSEGIDYIVTKCTHDDPQMRYQDCKELREDLDNIQRLTLEYHRSMTNKLLSFVSMGLAAVLFFGVAALGYGGVTTQNEDRFNSAVQAASNYESNGEMGLAAQKYTEAIEYRPDDYETYLHLFRVLLPKGDSENFDREIFADKTVEAIDTLRQRYLENNKSPMYHNDYLMMAVARKCLEIPEKSAYARHAYEYLQRVKQGKLYATGEFGDADALEILALFHSGTIEAVDYSRLGEALLELEAKADNISVQISERLDNYYIIIRTYATYVTHLENAEQRIYEVGIKAKSAVEAIDDLESQNFSSVVPLYETVATAMYTSATRHEDASDEKIGAYRKCLEWYGYLDAYGELSEKPMLRRGNASRYLAAQLRAMEGNSAEASALLEQSINIYQTVLRNYPSSFLAQVCLTHSYLDVEMAKESIVRDFSKVMQTYAKAKQMRVEQVSPKPTELQQYLTLQKQMELAGLEI